MEFETERKRLIQTLRRRGISERVLAAMEKVPRHLFVTEKERRHSYEDYPLHIGSGQTISAPHMVAIMCDVLDIREGHKILEIGAGSGYHAAVMAELVGANGHVYAVERIPELVEFATANLASAGCTGVTVILGDGSLGLPGLAPFDRISVAAASPDIPATLTDQLREGGKMVIPVGRFYQELYLVTKMNGIKKEDKGGVVFVPLVGEHGFS
ncbi:MAG TPA: protein-L-isoaspartate(D-aspartate) O-methyltransferase [Candidatus Methanoperedenaceae archaeon]|nr:protein-L-isoaspartate(D-aspartate) O-methyltransferase [Candidatus Methanoperedenaceae archaeon]